MKKTTLKALSLIVCMAMLLSAATVFSSCKKEEKELPKIVLVENGNAYYKIVRPDRSSKDILNTIIGFQNSISSACGCRIDIISDWVRSEADIDPDAKELLVGATNRPESQEVLSTLEPNSWAVVSKGNKIVICANNDTLLPVAINWFVENCVNSKEGTVKVTEKLVKTEGFGNDLPISVGGVSGYQIVYPKGNANLEYYASLIQRKAKISTVVSDDKPKGDYEIILGNANRDDTTAVSGNNAYSIRTIGSKVYINASNEDALYYALNYYIEYGMNIKETVISSIADYSADGVLNNYYKDKWEVNLPYVDEQNVSRAFDIGTGVEDDANGKTQIDSYMHLVSNVKFDAFEKYAQKLESFGFKKIHESKTDKNDLWFYRLGAAYAYIHYAPNNSQMRVIWDKSSNCEIPDISYTEKQTGTTTLYQYSLDSEKAELNNAGVGISFGLLYIVKLQDNTLILNDSGGDLSHYQENKDSFKGLEDFLYEITGTDQNHPLHIRLWYITHPDGDHFGAVSGFVKYLKGKGKMPIVDTFAFNFPSANSNTTIKEHGTPTSLIDCIKQNYPTANYLKVHTGMVFNIGEVQIEILGSIENIVKVKQTNLYIESTWDTNDTGVMARFTFGGKSVLLMADIRANVEDLHLGLYSKEYIKSDIYQVPHHGYNLLYKVVEYCDPEYVLISNAKEVLAEQPTKYNFYNSIVPKGKYHYAGDYTTAIAVTNGKITLTKIPRYDNPTGKL